MSTDQTSPNEPITVDAYYVCVGLRGDGKKFVQYWAKLSAKNALLEGSYTLSSWPKPLVSYAKPGEVYRLIQDEKGATYTSGDKSPAFSYLYENESHRLEWALQTRTFQAQQDAERMAKGRKDELETALAPLRDVLRKQFGKKRTAMIATIVDYLTR